MIDRLAAPEASQEPDGLVGPGPPLLHGHARSPEVGVVLSADPDAHADAAT